MNKNCFTETQMDLFNREGWNVTVNVNEDGNYECIFENWSPKGENLIVEATGRDCQAVAIDLYQYYDAFDAESHAVMWYEAKASGAPSSLRALLEDADEIEEMYDKLWRIAKFGTLTQYKVSEIIPA